MQTPFDQPEKESFAPVARLAHHLLAVPISFVTVVDSVGRPATHLFDPDAEDERSDHKNDHTVDWAPVSAAVAELVRSVDSVLEIRDGRSDPRIADFIPASNTCACIAEQLVDISGEVCGVFGVIDRQQRTWTDQDRLTLSDLSGFAIAEIERRHAGRLKLAQDHSTEQLFHLARALTSASGIEEIMQRTSRIAGDLVGASLANAAVVDREAGDMKLHYGKLISEGESERSARLPLNEASPLGRAVLTGVPVHMSNPHEIARGFPLEASDAASAGLQALAAYPTRRGHAAIGFAWTHPVVFDDPLRRTLGTVAELFGLGLERASASDRDRAVAEHLQRSLLPGALPFVPGAQTAAMYEAGAANLEVGGDWYDIVAAGPDRYLIGIGDVVGRGLHAAVTMGQMRHAFAALVSRTGSLGEIVKNLDHFAQNVEGARLSTLVAASYEPSTGDLELISAGHMPPMIHRSDGSVTQLPDGGPPLGLGGDLTRSTINITLAAGDSLWLYTDGLVERKGESVDVGLGRLREAIQKTRVDTSVVALRDVYQALGRPIDDDVAVLILMR